MSRWYFETSGFNHIVKTLSFDAFLCARNLQSTLGRQLLISPVTLWELMLSNGKLDSEFLIYSAQNFFCSDMLALPSELIVRYMKSAYPRNVVNYGVNTDLMVGEIWSKMTENNSITYQYEKSDLRRKTEFLREVSKKLPKILQNEKLDESSALFSLASILDVSYSVLKGEGLLFEFEGYDTETLYKLVILFELIFFVVKIDLDSSAIDQFWSDEGFSGDEVSKLIYLFEKYPELFRVGPILEMAVMAYSQVRSGIVNRGILLDCYHMIYAPYVDYIVTGDEGFRNLRRLESRYIDKIIHVEQMPMREIS